MFSFIGIRSVSVDTKPEISTSVIEVKKVGRCIPIVNVPYVCVSSTGVSAAGVWP